MVIDYELTKEDFIQFNLYHYKESPSQQKSSVAARYILPVVFGIILFAIGSQVLKQPPLYWGIIAAIFVVGSIIIYPMQEKRVIRRQLNRMLSEGDLQNLLGKKQMKIEGTKATIQNGDVTETFDASSITKVRVYSDMILLYHSEMTAQIIPTRDLTKEQQEALLAIFSPKKEDTR